MNSSSYKILEIKYEQVVKSYFLGFAFAFGFAFGFCFLSLLILFTSHEFEPIFSWTAARTSP